jgi:hypothetical protein
MSEISIHELETQHVEVLPEREALGTHVIGSFNHVTAISHASTFQLGSDHSLAIALAAQTVTVS